MGDFLKGALREYEPVILDAPAVLALADGQALTALAAPAIMVVRAGNSHYCLMPTAIELLKPKPVGVVSNGVGPLVTSYYYGICKKNRGAQ